jgi:hypothetical protein
MALGSAKPQHEEHNQMKRTITASAAKAKRAERLRRLRELGLCEHCYADHHARPWDHAANCPDFEGPSAEQAWGMA